MEVVYDRLRAYRKEIAVALGVFLISSLSFGLGYLANRENSHTPIIIEKCSGPPAA